MKINISEKDAEQIAYQLRSDAHCTVDREYAARLNKLANLICVQFTPGQKVHNSRGHELTVCIQNGCIVTVYEDPMSYHAGDLTDAQEAGK